MASKSTPAPPRCIVRDRTGRCDRPQAVLDKQLCTAHYKRLQRTGRVGPAKLGTWTRLPAVGIPGLKDPTRCKVRGCPDPVVYKKQQLCRPHYERLRVQVRIQKRRAVDLQPIHPRKRKKEQVA